MALARQKSLEKLVLEYCDISEAQKSQIMKVVKLLNAPKSEVIFSKDDKRTVERQESEEKSSLQPKETDDEEEKSSSESKKSMSYL